MILAAVNAIYAIALSLKQYRISTGFEPVTSRHCEVRNWRHLWQLKFSHDVHPAMVADHPNSPRTTI